MEHARGWEVAIMREFFSCDFEPDGDVDMDDLIWFVGSWLGSDCKGNLSYGCNGSDLNNDGEVNISDFAIFAGYWLK